MKSYSVGGGHGYLTGFPDRGESNQYWSHDEPVLVTIVKQY